MKTNKYISALKSVLIITVGFIVIYLTSKWIWALWIAVAIGFCGMASKYLTVKIDFLWRQLARLLNLIIPNLLLTVVYFIMLVPIAMLSRLFTKQDHLHKKNSPDSLFEKQDKAFDPPSFEKPW
ncbi:MAG: hypothetical protein PF590_10050 [Candidatus Delongbacteria bacterium]|jgi:hypothetical protein|nr:hypothetical protein [Candidatus Delongbacteria bacterium]